MCHWIFEWHWHITVVSEQKTVLPLFSPSKTSTGLSGAEGRWLQIDNHQCSLSWFLDLLLSSFPNYLIMYRKLFINIFHLQQFAQVINYFKCLSISNDWFPPWYTPRCSFLVTCRHVVVRQVLTHFPWYICSKLILYNKYQPHENLSHNLTFNTLRLQSVLTAGRFEVSVIRFFLCIKSDLTLWLFLVISSQRC